MHILAALFHPMEDLPTLQAQPGPTRRTLNASTWLLLISRRFRVDYSLYEVDFPSTSKKAHNALVSARPTPIHIARRKLSAKAAAITCCNSAWSVPCTVAGTWVAASLGRWSSSNCRIVGETCSASRRLSRLLLQECRTKMLSTAIASRPATRATALLMPEAIPA